MNALILSGRVISFRNHKTVKGQKVVNILLRDDDEPKRPVFKIALWDQDEARTQDIQKGDQISIEGIICDQLSNDRGSYSDVKVTKLLSISRIKQERELIYESEPAVKINDDTPRPTGNAPTKTGGAE